MVFSQRGSNDLAIITHKMCRSKFENLSTNQNYLSENDFDHRFYKGKGMGKSMKNLFRVLAKNLLGGTILVPQLSIPHYLFLV